MSALIQHTEQRLKLAADYLPPCPNCSLRSMPPKAPAFWRARHSDGLMLAPCCRLSKDSPIVLFPELKSGTREEVIRAAREGEAKVRRDLANWWKLRRMTGKPEMLALFRERGLTQEMEATK